MRDKAIITSALPYSNGEIHLGHVASTYLPADVTTRFLKQKGVAERLYTQHTEKHTHTHTEKNTYNTNTLRERHTAIEKQIL